MNTTDDDDAYLDGGVKVAKRILDVGKSTLDGLELTLADEGSGSSDGSAGNESLDEDVGEMHCDLCVVLLSEGFSSIVEANALVSRRCFGR